MWPKITINYSPNFNIPKRSKKKIKFIIIHYTGMKKESLAIKRLSDYRSNVSAHYFVKNNGEIINLVPDLYEAWHAGISNWKNYKSINKNSIGIEIQNQGHDFGYKKFSFKQINSLKKLIKKLIDLYAINKDDILGHSDISPDRKKDPGEKFPWKNLAKNGLAKWHDLDEKLLKKLRLKKLKTVEEKKFLKNLYSIGYCKIKNSSSGYNKKTIFTAFQRKYRQSLINGKSDQECLLISKKLLKN